MASEKFPLLHSERGKKLETDLLMDLLRNEKKYDGMDTCYKKKYQVRNECPDIPKLLPCAFISGMFTILLNTNHCIPFKVITSLQIE